MSSFYSPKDQAILEAEYKQNPKPNKAARAEIVVKVDLNEKEVQVCILAAVVAVMLPRVVCKMRSVADISDMVPEPKTNQPQKVQAVITT